MNSRLQIWVSAFRPRTLPLAVASISLGSFLAASGGQFHWHVTVLCLITALFLQVLSNLANDYGDTVHGADSAARVGPTRASQLGQISRQAMRGALLLFVGLCLGAGYLLIAGEGVFFYILGIAAIVAAVAYTAGPKPYGYVGMGDLFVFLFFGLAGVAGTYFLHTHQMNYEVLLPAITCGLFCVAVLNINNMRDAASDVQAGKITIPVRIGLSKARIYHWVLLMTGFLSASVYIFINFTSPWQLLFLIILPLIIKNGISISAQTEAAQLDPHLRQMAVATLLFSLAFGVGIVL